MSPAMTRLLALAALFVIAFGVFASASIYAAPLAAYDAAAGDVCAVAADSMAVHASSGKVCAKRHSLGVPCSPTQAVLPPTVTCLAVEVVDPVFPPVLTLKSLAEYGRLFRPPRLPVA